MKPKSFFYVLLGVCGGLVLLGIVGYYFGSRVLIAKKQELMKKETDLDLVEERSSQLVELKRHYEDAVKKLDEITRALPTNKQQAEVVVSLKDVAARTGMELPSIQFSASGAPTKGKVDPNYTQTTTVGDLYVLPIWLKMSGNYSQLVSFLTEVENLSRFNSVTDLSLTTVAGQNKLEVNLTINAYLKP